MQTPAVPANEGDRQAALDALEILDTPMEAAFDGIVQIAAQVLDVPIALLSLVDRDRQWFKARVGLEASELSRDVSFCGHVVADGQPLEVPDAHADERFADNPVVTGAPHVRFYAGMPLTTAEGHTVGTLCAVDHRPRTLTEGQRQSLDLLARQVVYLLEKRRMRLDAMRGRAAAQRTADRLAALVDSMAEGMVVQGSDGRILESNSAASRILGLSDAELRGVTSIDPRWRSVHEDGSPFPGETHPAMVALRTRAPQRNVVMGVHKPDGTLTWISINSMPIPDRDGTSLEVVTTFHDISPIKHAFERLSRQERLALTGTLVAGIGHEINNPLSVVLSNIEAVKDEVAVLAGATPSSRMRELLDMLGDARVGADRVRRIARGLRALERGPSVLRPVGLAGVVDTALGMAEHELRQRATVTVDVPATLMVHGDDARLTQLVVHLLINAAQSFAHADPERNRVTVRAAPVGPDGVRLSVQDTGQGIAAEIVPRIFDPFFTTKPVGTGTGLGLAIARQIATDLGGDLTVESVEGAGTVFHLTLAAEVGAAPAAPATEEEPRASRRGRVVVIDDDAAILTSYARVLGREHDVTTFVDPRAALAAIGGGLEADVIFCDLMMPHLTGHDVAREVARTHPALLTRIVFMTGGATRAPERQFLAALSNELLEKPFGMRELLAVARRYVDAA
ncbi:MAG: ATP-binding protein [Gemmatimonadaceae bacterium]|nr:ATP-binding protein [Gemmatimonadaceae bacterium]